MCNDEKRSKGIRFYELRNVFKPGRRRNRDYAYGEDRTWGIEGGINKSNRKDELARARIGHRARGVRIVQMARGYILWLTDGYSDKGKQQREGSMDLSGKFGLSRSNG